MKAKLLKILRKDKRYSITHRHKIDGYPYSGWWYLTDHKLEISHRSKKLADCVNDYYTLIQGKIQIRKYKIIVFLCLLFLIIFFSSCVENEPPVEVWNPYTNSIDSTVQEESELLLLLEEAIKKDTLINQ